MTDHCFISYSVADGLTFATKLADELQGRQPFIKVWFDKREMDASIVDWDDQLANAIKGCKCLVFVMTVDSAAKGSTCKEEWTWALKYKKPVICLLKDKKAEVPFRLNNRQYIDISTDFNSGIAQLRTAIKRLDEPEGILEELDRRLSQAKRDLQRTAHEEEKPRIQAEIEELNKQIEAQQKIVDNPKKAEEQTQKNIEAGLERERKPEKPTAAQTNTKFINPPPGIAPNYFQDRLIETKQVIEFLNDNSQRLMTIVGRGGVGKTAMVCRLLKGIESGTLPDDLGEMKADGIVYLSEAGSHRVNFANIFYDLCKLLPNDAAQVLDAIYKNPQGSTESKMRALLDQFPAGKFALLLDNIEPLINVETFKIGDTELDESLCAFLHGAHSAVKIIMTTRIAPRGLNLCEPGRQRIYHIEEGLPSPYAEKMLRELDVDGTLGLKDAKEELLKRARIKTRGFPKGLEAFKQILASDRYTTLEELLAMPTPENVVEALVGEAFNRLDVNAQKVMQALAVYNRPVTPAAVDYLLAPHLPAIDSAPILQRLANMHFARKESGRFYLHPVDREFAFGLIARGKKKGERSDSDELRFTQYELLDRAADYFRDTRQPHETYKKLNDIFAQLAEFDLRYMAENYEDAGKVLCEFYKYLDLWGHYILMINLHERIAGKINDVDAQLHNLRGLGTAYIKIGTGRESLVPLEKGLSISQEFQKRKWECSFCASLGLAYSGLGEIPKGIGLYEQALLIAREISDRNSEANCLGNLGNRYNELGETNKAIEFHEKALNIAHDMNFKMQTGFWLWGLGSDYSDLGELRKAINYYQQALAIQREVGNRYSEMLNLVGLGSAYYHLGEISKAIEFYEQALIIAHEIGNQKSEYHILFRIGYIYDDLGNASKAIEFYEQALVIARKIGDKSFEGDCFDNSGFAFLELEEYQKAIDKFLQSIQIADEILDSTIQIDARIGLSESYLLQNDLVNACATIEAALQYDMPQYNHDATSLHGIIAMRQGDEVTARQAFTRAIAQADEILAKTPDYYSALDAKGLALSGLTICDPSTTLRAGLRFSIDDGQRTVDDPTGTLRSGQSSMVYRQQAIETFQKARKIAPHAGVVKSVLRLFDELAKCDTNGVLKEVRKSAEGKE